WLPAILWVVFGTIFFAGVHDFGTLWISSRHKGRSMGAIAEDQIGARSRTLFMLIIFVLLMMVNAVFAIVIARLLVSFPGAVIPVWLQIPVAMTVGYVIHKKGGGLLIPSIAALITLYLLIWVGSVFPLELSEVTLIGLPNHATWVLILFVYAGIASLLPVWLLLQPRDYVNSHQLFVALGILYLGVLFSNPSMAAPMFNADPVGAPPLIPVLFITIACGAISGWHGMVSSGTSSKQLDKETDARFVGYAGAVGEGTLALGAILATGAGLAATRADWGAIYSNWGAASGGAAGNFVSGFAALAGGIGVPPELASVLGAVVVIMFAATTMDSGVRVQRYVLSEIGQIGNIRFLQKGAPATIIAVLSCLVLAFGAQPPGVEIGGGGLVIWPLFGTTNQLLAALSLLCVTLFLKRLGRNYLPALIPMVFLLIVTIAAMSISILQWLGITSDAPNYLLGIMGVLILFSALWMLVEAVLAFRKIKPQGDNAADTVEGVPVQP
ncbi:MAG: carbon starvation protein A, partial [Spirochaetota bacterium]